MKNTEGVCKPMHQRAALALFSLVVLAAAAMPVAVEAQEEEAYSVLQATNFDLKAMWMDIRLESLEFYTLGRGRAGVRAHQLPFRWVAGDARRGAAGPGLSFYVDPGWGAATANGVPRSALEAAIRRAAATWDADSCLAGRPLVERKGDLGDVTVTDFFLGTGPFGDPFAADVVFGGWVGGGEPLFRPDTLAVSATYVFVHRDSGEPTDLDRDGHMDVALNEIWFNDAFDWTTSAAAGAIDVEATALHELGHALALGHFGLPPEAVMNPVYDGPARRLQPLDHAGLCSVWGGGK
jgi:hypothetical protein